MNFKREILAFPVPREFYHDGMTLRDYFAAAVLNGLFSRESIKTDREERAVMASFAYDMADRMIKARAVLSDTSVYNYDDSDALADWEKG
jgi:hypothetical protein